MLDGNLAISTEFHWGGGQHQVLPLCRDLAMRAMGEAAYIGASSEALALLRQTLMDELAVSDEALLGVLGACEHDLNWQGAIDIMFLLLDDTNQTLRFVAGSELIPVRQPFQIRLISVEQSFQIRCTFQQTRQQFQQLDFPISHDLVPT